MSSTGPSRSSNGPSPRVRGSRGAREGPRPPAGSIPACAGKPRVSSPSPRRRRVHPRVCGEATGILGAAVKHAGPSPRVRGSLHITNRTANHRGSIPACAGKPGGRRPAWPPTTVHPRVCGEAALRAPVLRKAPGPSPRVRGSRLRPASCASSTGSIPACAGKPSGSASSRRQGWVHPRVCGEAYAGNTSIGIPMGPSPRVRGSPRHRPCAAADVGSIPACAGKPAAGFFGMSPSPVHPRVCGEAHCDADVQAVERGPSPACAGKPRAAMRRSTRRRVHPRVCGEASMAYSVTEVGVGPSPRVRGSPRPTVRGVRACGSIPACAGKPPA